MEGFITRSRPSPCAHPPNSKSPPDALPRSVFRWFYLVQCVITNWSNTVYLAVRQGTCSEATVIPAWNQDQPLRLSPRLAAVQYHSKQRHRQQKHPAITCKTRQKRIFGGRASHKGRKIHCLKMSQLPTARGEQSSPRPTLSLFLPYHLAVFASQVKLKYIPALDTFYEL